MTILSTLGVPVYTPEELKSISVYAIEHPDSKRTSSQTGKFYSFCGKCFRNTLRGCCLFDKLTLFLGVFRSVLSPNELLKGYANHSTIVDLFEMGVALNPNGPCLGHRTCTYDPVTGLPKSWSGYQWQTYTQISKRRFDFGRGLQFVHNEVLHLPSADKWHLGIYAVNRPEWVIADFGAQLFSNVTVALYDTLGPETAEFIINHAEIPILVTSLDKVGNVLNLSAKCPKLKLIIVMDDNFPALKEANVSPLKVYKQWAIEKNVLIYTFSEIEALGRKHQIPPRLPKASDLFCICYTSGIFCLIFLFL
jgi:long-chain acyl-CoA synthetase